MSFYRALWLYARTRKKYGTALLMGLMAMTAWVLQ